MSLRKNFKNLSVSQKNKRLFKAYNFIQNTRDANINNISDVNVQESDEICSSNNSVNCEIVHSENYIDNSIDINNDNSDNNDNNSEDNHCIQNELHDMLDDNIVLNKTSNFKEELKKWVCEYNITHRATGALLKLLKNVDDIDKLQSLPLDPRTLLETPKHIVLREVPPGKYFHYGLRNALINILKTVNINTISRNIEININVDGLPLTKSSKSQFCPILGEIYPRVCEPFIIGVYHGYNKPANPNVFLNEFIEEYILLHEKGIEFNEIQFTVAIRCVICDSPAKSFVKCTKAFNGYFGCSKCMQEGDYSNHRMIFLETNAKLRTDENFISQENEEHHIGRSIFERANLGMVSQFPLDYMHLVCLGVVKKMLQIFVHGKIKAIKCNSAVTQEISEALCNMSAWIPNDFARKTRGLEELDRWKATELRLFLLYVGPVILQNYLPHNYLLHFNSLHCAIRILCHEKDCINNNKYAKDLLVYFVETSKILYGNDFIIYNVHNLIHIPDDVVKFGHLDSFSTFSFENFLYEIKKQMKKAEKPLQQLHNRLVERAQYKQKRQEYYFSKPQVAQYNSKKSNETRLAYDSIFYKTFKLSLKKESDSFCYLKNNNVFRIENIYKYNEEFIMQGKILINSCNLPHYPVDSKLFNIIVGNEWSELQNVPIDEIKMKAICLPHKNSVCFFPIIHSCV